MSRNFDEITEKVTIDSATDHVVGYATGPASRRWTFATIKTWLDTLFAPLSHVANTGNPHAVTKTQIGLGSVDNTADTAKPVSALQAAADAAVAAAATAALGVHTADVANPHGVTKAQVGLSAAENTADLDKPISTLTAAALATKLTSASPLPAANLTGTIDPARIASGTALQVLRRNAANTALEFANVGLGTGDLLAANNLSDIPTPATARTNLGLGNVDNTSDLSKPVSTATAAAIAALASQAALDAHTANNSNPHAVTKTQVGLGNVTDVAQIPLSYLDTDITLAADSDVKVPSQKAIKAYVDAAAPAGVLLSANNLSDLGSVATAKANLSLDQVTNHAQLKASDLDTDGTLAANSDTKIPSQKAVKTYVDALGGGGGGGASIIETQVFS